MIYTQHDFMPKAILWSYWRTNFLLWERAIGAIFPKAFLPFLCRYKHKLFVGAPYFSLLYNKNRKDIKNEAKQKRLLLPVLSVLLSLCKKRREGRKVSYFLFFCFSRSKIPLQRWRFCWDSVRIFRTKIQYNGNFVRNYYQNRCSSSSFSSLLYEFTL